MSSSFHRVQTDRVQIRKRPGLPTPAAFTACSRRTREASESRGRRSTLAPPRRRSVRLGGVVRRRTRLFVAVDRAFLALFAGGQSSQKSYIFAGESGVGAGGVGDSSCAYGWGSRSRGRHYTQVDAAPIVPRARHTRCHALRLTHVSAYGLTRAFYTNPNTLGIPPSTSSRSATRMSMRMERKITALASQPSPL